MREFGKADLWILAVYQPCALQVDDDVERLAARDLILIGLKIQYALANRSLRFYF
jgi:hypothetical protein